MPIKGYKHYEIEEIRKKVFAEIKKLFPLNDFEVGLNFLRRLIEKNLEQDVFEFPAEDRRLSFLYAFLRDYCIGCGKNSFKCKGGCVDGVDEAVISINKLKSSFYEKRTKGRRGE